ncbi:MAG: hypothetical protein CL868_06275 [Cytophagaceae bacterium]|nr:hypothetical protein [Cytophagaceae bacterium]|tara:strand:- start:4720 stop:5223 length:504 start_codon:yes stop_codon:yes gene_type:complete
MAYDLDFHEEGDLILHIKKFFLHPSSWNEAENQIPITLSWRKYKFSPQNRTKIPTSSGVYAFVVIPEFDNCFETKYLFYAGKTNRTLRERYAEYLRERAGKGKPRNKVFKMFKQYDGYLHFFFSEIENSNDVDSCEDCLLNTFVPHVNVQIAKAKIKPELQYIYESA